MAGTSGYENKYCDGKPQFHKIVPEFSEGLACQLTHGNSKYDEDSWKTIPKEEYVGALERHFNAYRRGEDIDPETGLLHLDAVAACTMFLRWFSTQDEKLARKIRANIKAKTYIYKGGPSGSIK